MKLQNPFSTDTRELFRDVQYRCWECGGNGQGDGGTELNHTIGRFSSSPLNASVLCKKCHARVGHTEEEHVKYIRKTMSYLITSDYELQEVDYAFIRKNKLLFDKVLHERD